MAKKILYITKLAGRRVNGFMRSAVIAAKKVGLDFTLASNMVCADKKAYEEDCKRFGIKTVHICFNRNPINPQNIKAYYQLKTLMQQEKFDIVHCNTLIGGLLGRICAKETGIKHVIYMAHGFQFWNNAPLIDWLLFYPMERLLGRITNELVTINNEDYQRASRFHLSKNGIVTLIHGVGVETNKFDNKKSGNIRKEFGFDSNSIIFITIGELIPRKNHLKLISAFQKANVKNAKLLICGAGKLRNTIAEYIHHHNLNDRVYLLGYRNDIPDLLADSDIFVFPSLQEGLPGALMEAMASGKACLASRIRGNIDLLGEDYEYLFDLHDEKQLVEMIKDIPNNIIKCGLVCKERIKRYDLNNIVDEFSELYMRAIRAVE